MYYGQMKHAITGSGAVSASIPACLMRKLLQKQKEFIYTTLPEMDFHIKHLELNGKKLKGVELQEYLDQPGAYQNILYVYGVYGSQNLYEENNYNDGKNVKKYCI